MIELSDEEEIKRCEKICDKYRRPDGMLEFENDEEFYGMLEQLVPTHKVIDLSEGSFALVPTDAKICFDREEK